MVHSREGLKAAIKTRGAIGTQFTGVKSAIQNGFRIREKRHDYK